MIIIADNIQITDPVIETALKEMDPRPIGELAKRCEESGAQVLDINPGPLTREGREKMTFLLESVQGVTTLPLSLDTTNPEAMEAGLKACRGSPILNGFSLEPGKMERILPLAREYDCDIIGFLLEPSGKVPGTAEERLSVAWKLYEAFLSEGLEPERLVIDPVVVPLLWEDGPGQAMAVLEVIRLLPDLLGFPVKTVVGLSNLTSGRGPQEKKRVLEGAYLGMLAGAGLDMVLMNALHRGTMATARACGAVGRGGIFTWEEVQ